MPSTKPPAGRWGGTHPPPPGRLQPGAPMYIGFVGSRHLSGPAIATATQILAALPSGATPQTGCCPSGLDLAVRSWCAAHSAPLRVFKASIRAAKVLRARTIHLVQSSSLVLSFPVSACPIRSGSWLAVWSAVRAGVPVLVHLPGSSPAALPCLAGVTGWQAAALPFCAGVPFYRPLISQGSLFKPVQPGTTEPGHF
jgi:hypothetical protein